MKRVKLNERVKLIPKTERVRLKPKAEPDERVRLKPKAPTRLVINIDKRWRLVSEGGQFTVDELVTPRKGGASYWKGNGYLTSLSLAINWVSQRRVISIPGEFPTEALTVMTDALARIEQETKEAVNTMCLAILADNTFTEAFAERHLTHLLIPAPRPIHVVVPPEYRQADGEDGIPAFLRREPERVRIVRKTPPVQSGIRGAGEGQTRSPSPDTGKQGKPPHAEQGAKRKGPK